VRESARERVGLKVKGRKRGRRTFHVQAAPRFLEGPGYRTYVDRDDRGGRRGFVSPRRQSVSRCRVV
jgi:hypothetical protein